MDTGGTAEHYDPANRRRVERIQGAQSVYRRQMIGCLQGRVQRNIILGLSLRGLHCRIDNKYLTDGHFLPALLVHFDVRLILDRLGRKTIFEVAFADGVFAQGRGLHQVFFPSQRNGRMIIGFEDYSIAKLSFHFDAWNLFTCVIKGNMKPA